MKSGTLATFTALLVVVVPAAQAPGGSTNVEVVVNSSLYDSGQITLSLNRYLNDIRNQGFHPALTTTSFAGAADLRSHLAGKYGAQGLAGAVFIGDLPNANFEMNYWEPEVFLCDLFFQDMDGTWTDTDGNGIYDSHTAGAGDVAPDIWFGRLSTSALTGLHPGRTEASLINDYFAKNHAYRTGQHTVASNALAYVDDDWQSSAGQWGGALAVSVAGTTTIISDPATTNPTDYKSRLQQEHESVLLACHANYTTNGHGFDKHLSDASNVKMFWSSELKEVNPKVLFWNLFVCTSAVWTADGYTAGEYVFGPDYPLLAIASTKTGGMLQFQDYYTPLGEGALFGEAMQDWWAARAAGGFTSSEAAWYYGMTLIGDPLLLTQEHIPEPATLSLVGAGVLVLLRRGRRRQRRGERGMAGR